MNKKALAETCTLAPIPTAQRHGKPWHLGPFWFTGNFVLTTLVTGFTGPAMGLGVWHALLAIFVGVALGTFCVALHANQGPRLGVPQMLQSRAQFGLRGALLPLLATLLVYMAFNVFNLILATDALAVVLPGTSPVWYAVLLALAATLAILGHDGLHRFQRYLAWPLILVFALLTLAALLLLEADTAQRHVQFAWPAFFAQLSAAASYQVSYAVYMSDYSRYLPANAASRKVIGWTFLGAATSAWWLMSLGALLASALPAPDAIASLQNLGNRFLPGFGTFAVLMAVPPLIGIMALNCYGAALTSLTMLSAVHPLKVNRKARVLAILAFAVIVYLCAIALPNSQLNTFNTFLLLMLYLLVPWSAINLTDFYLVRRGRYDVEALFDPDGRYRRWAWPGLLAYLGGLLCMLPFFALGDYLGPAVAALRYADVAFLVGFFSSGLCYGLLVWGADFSEAPEHQQP